MEIKYIIFWIFIAIILAYIALTWKSDIEINVELSIKDEKKESEYPTTLREWLAYTKKKNLSIEELKFLILNENDCNFNNIYLKLKGGLGAQKKAEYLFKQWNTIRKPRVKKTTTNIE